MNTVRRTLCTILAIGLVGCATIMQRGTKQWVSIVSTPAGATATIDGMQEIQTPGQVKLKRGKDHTVKVEKDAYEPAVTMIDHEMSMWVLGNALFGGLIGLAVDFGTGGAYKLEPNEIHVTLKEKPAIVVPPAAPATVPAATPAPVLVPAPAQ